MDSMIWLVLLMNQMLNRMADTTMMSRAVRPAFHRLLIPFLGKVLLMLRVQLKGWPAQWKKINSTHVCPIVYCIFRTNQVQLSVPVLGGQDHALRLDAPHFSGGQVGHHHHLPVDERFGGKMLGNAGEDGAGFCAQVHL